MRTLLREWEAVKAGVMALAEGRAALREKERAKTTEQIGKTLRDFADRIAAVQVLDPACGSGNFLYVALRRLLDLQKEVINLSDELGAGRFFPSVEPSATARDRNQRIRLRAGAGDDPDRVYPVAEGQRYGLPGEPILKPMEGMLHMDAVLAYDASGSRLSRNGQGRT
jgi:hypothetical protein